MGFEPMNFLWTQNMLDIPLFEGSQKVPSTVAFWKFE